MPRDVQLFRKLVNKVKGNLIEKGKPKRLISRDLDRLGKISIIDCAYLAHKDGRREVLKYIIDKFNSIEIPKKLELSSIKENDRLYFLI